MTILSEKNGLERLREIKDRYRTAISISYEHNARSCALCPTPGACCLDEHFVNVRISRLEAMAIRRVLEALPEEHRGQVYRRVDMAIETYGLDAGADPFEATFACPLFEKGVGCLVHSSAKPLPCIHHACYEREEDVPPDELLDEAQLAVDRLNRRAFGRGLPILPLPVAVRSAAPDRSL
jgi:hypothetical protein